MVSVPISGIWEHAHTSASKRKQTEIAESERARVRELLRLEIEHARSELSTAWRASLASELAVEQADVNVREVSDQYANGLVTFSDVLEAEALRQEAASRRIDAQVDYWLKRSAYLRAVVAEDDAR